MNTREIIENSDLILTEVSFPATGQEIELGWADVAKIPIMCVSKVGAKVSGSLKHLTNEFIEYSDMQDLMKKLEKKIN